MRAKYEKNNTILFDIKSYIINNFFYYSNSINRKGELNFFMVSEDTEYDRLYNAICSIIANLKEEGIGIQTKFEKDSGFIGLYTSNTSVLKRAKIGLNEILELSYSTAEHHPYWNIIYNTSEIAKTTLDSWDENFSNDQIQEMLWRNDEIKNTLTRLEK